MSKVKLAVLLLLLPAVCACVSDKDSVPMMDEATYSTFPALGVEDFESLFAGSAVVSIRGPAGVYPESADPAHQYRMLAKNGDGLGGVAIDLSGNPKLVSKLLDVSQGGETLWLVVKGRVEQFVTKDHMNRESMPDAIFRDAEVLGYYVTPEHRFSQQPGP